MKKLFILFLLFSISTFSQTKVKAFIQKDNNLNFEQYDLIKEVNRYNKDILISKVATNNYWNDLQNEELIESYLKFDNIPSDCKSYSVLIYPDNTRIDYSYELISGEIHYGNVTWFGGKVFRMDFSIKDKVLKHFYKENDKIVYQY